MQRNMTKTRGRKKEGDRDTLSCIRGHDNSWRSDTATTGHHGVRCRARHDIVFFFLSVFTRPHVEFLVAVQLTAKVMINQQWDRTVYGFITGSK